MAITVTLPVSAPTGLSATLQAGGTLAASTTYYYVIASYYDKYISPGSSNRFGYHSEISAEDSFTTDSTNKSALINWTNCTEHNAGTTRYQIFLTTTSGDYTDSRPFATSNYENVGTITDGTTGYTITGVSTWAGVYHSCQLTNDFINNIDRDTGVIKIDLSGGTYTLQTIYNAIVSAGFSNYVFWDGYNFTLKGWIVTSGTDSGSFVTEQKNIVFIKGGIHCANPNYIVRFGRWWSDVVGANYLYACKIDLQHSRYPFRSMYDGVLQVYGCIVSKGHSRILTLGEPLVESYYTGSGQLYQGYDISEIKDNILGVNIRSISSRVKDLKVGIGNNFSNYPMFRLKVYTGSTTMPYTTGAKLYKIDFLIDQIHRHYVPAAGNTFWVDYFDCTFPLSPNELLEAGYMTSYGTLTSDSYFQVNYSINLNIIDADGNAIEGATVDIVDSNGDSAVYIEHDGTFDKEVTGDTYNTPRTTDVNGDMNTYYIKAYKVNLAPDNTIASSSCTNIITTNYYPFNILVSKGGYKTVEIADITPTSPIDWTITLKKIYIKDFNIIRN